MSCEPKRIIKMCDHQSWGNNIFWSDYSKGRLTGWMFPKPKVGDIVRCQMKSGKIARFEITKIEHAHNVNDMFFADTKPLYYE